MLDCDWLEYSFRRGGHIFHRDKVLERAKRGYIYTSLPATRHPSLIILIDYLITLHKNIISVHPAAPIILEYWMEDPKYCMLIIKLSPLKAYLLQLVQLYVNAVLRIRS